MSVDRAEAEAEAEEDDDSDDSDGSDGSDDSDDSDDSDRRGEGTRPCAPRGGARATSRAVPACQHVELHGGHADELTGTRSAWITPLCFSTRGWRLWFCLDYVDLKARA